MERVRQTKVVNKYGYVYHLIEGASDRIRTDIPKPCFMGYENFALYAVGKLTKHKRKTYNI